MGLLPHAPHKATGRHVGDAVVGGDPARVRAMHSGFFLAACVIMLGATLVPRDGTLNPEVASLFGIATLTLGVALRIPAIVPDRALAAMPALGVLTVTSGVLLVPPITGTPMFYLWPVLLAAYFESRRTLTVTLLAMAGSLGGVLLALPDEQARFILWVDTVIGLTLAGAVVSVLRSRLDEAVGRLYRSAMTDPLTGLLNRRAFDEALAAELGRAGRAGSAVTAIVFDLDHFKKINDELGHAAGDETLRRFAAVLTAEARAGDIVARLGGEEFVVVLAGSDEDGAAQYAERIGRTLQQLTLRHGRQVSVSAGIARLMPGEPERSLLTLADQALYAAKDAGRNRVAVWREGPAVGDPITLAA